MASDKLLHRIQLQIDDLTPVLELFVDDTIQPSVQDCEKLQKLLSSLQENIAVYKYNKQNKELSPSFNIHAKVSEKEAEQEKKIELLTEIKETVKLEKEEKTEAEHVVPDILKTETKGSGTEPLKPKLPLVIGINDKFRFMNELFAQNSSEYNIALEQINNVNTWQEAEIYLNSLKNVYEWDPKEEVVTYFYATVKKRFE
ncbi:MAG TPA: hypothetical protein VK622_10075 [Puia sp.]|nr:hypothetical protein [Puia sp.]